MSGDDRIEREIAQLLGPDYFKPQAIDPNGKPYPYDLRPARARLRELLRQCRSARLCNLK